MKVVMPTDSLGAAAGDDAASTKAALSEAVGNHVSPEGAFDAIAS